ncbi:MAG: DeoR/GlpR family DNA-binding transcription regulator [Victivallaceae bacterium]|nr:DeoR/GlpR family DNA-binding transcription regulator [Victivallaceae bacterium]
MNKRQEELLKRLHLKGIVEISEEANFFGVSGMTIRRDIRLLAKAGKVLITLKGAVPRSDVHEQAAASPPTPEKMAIAERALQLLKEEFPETKSIMLSTGSTVLEFSKLLAREDLPIAVLTNSLTVATTLFGGKTKVMLTGGELRNNSLDLIGPAAEQSLANYHVDILFTGCDGADAMQGFFYTADLNLANLENQSVKIAQTTVVLTTCDKFDRRSLARFANSSDIDYVITDRELTAEKKKMLATNGIKPLFSDPNELLKLK